jgi:hypothetical protein
MEETLERPLHSSLYGQLEKQTSASYVATLFHQETLDDAKNLSTDHHPLVPLLTQLHVYHHPTEAISQSHFLLLHHHGKNF